MDIGGGAGKVDKETEDLKRQIAQFERQASEEKDKAMKDADKKNDANREGLTNAGSNISGSFSAAALTAGGSGNPMLSAPTTSAISPYPYSCTSRVRCSPVRRSM